MDGQEYFFSSLMSVVPVLAGILYRAFPPCCRAVQLLGYWVSGIDGYLVSGKGMGMGTTARASACVHDAVIVHTGPSALMPKGSDAFQLPRAAYFCFLLIYVRSDIAPRQSNSSHRSGCMIMSSTPYGSNAI